MLAPLASEPSSMNPVTPSSANMLKRQETLEAMLDHGFITNDQYAEAMADTEAVYIRALENARSSTASYFNDALAEQLIEDLKKSGYRSYEATTLVYNGGLKIYSTQDYEIQSILNKEMSNEDNFPAVGEGSYYGLDENWTLSIYLGEDDENRWLHYHVDDLTAYYSNFHDKEGWYLHEDGEYGISTATLNVDDLNKKIDEFIRYTFRKSEGETFVESGRNITIQPQAAIVVTDFKTGNVLGLYGGRGRSITMSKNRASGSYYQPGSAFSVLASFLPALDTGGMNLASAKPSS